VVSHYDPIRLDSAKTDFAFRRAAKTECPVVVAFNQHVFSFKNAPTELKPLGRARAMPPHFTVIILAA
jgi:hypothetical protein